MCQVHASAQKGRIVGARVGIRRATEITAELVGKLAAVVSFVSRVNVNFPVLPGNRCATINALMSPRTLVIAESVEQPAREEQFAQQESVFALRDKPIAAAYARTFKWTEVTVVDAKRPARPGKFAPKVLVN